MTAKLLFSYAKYKLMVEIYRWMGAWGNSYFHWKSDRVMKQKHSKTGINWAFRENPDHQNVNEALLGEQHPYWLVVDLPL
jgi:hypothetical protein